MSATIAILVTFDWVHPPAVSTALAFAFQDTKKLNVLLFALAALMIALLVVVERGSLWILSRLRPKTS